MSCHLKGIKCYGLTGGFAGEPMRLYILSMKGASQGCLMDILSLAPLFFSLRVRAADGL